MRCYECAKVDRVEEAVGMCRSCSAGLCLVHMRDTARYFATGAIRIACGHDTWTAVALPAGNGGQEQ